MAVPMTVGDIVSITIQGRLDGQTTMNVLHYKLTSLGSLTEFPTWAVALGTKLNTAAELSSFYTDACSENLTDLFYRIQKIYPTRLVQAVINLSPSEGQIVESALPPGDQGSLTKRGIVAGRHSIGGIRMPALPITANEIGYLSGAQVALYDILCTYLAAPITTVTIGTLTPIIFNRTGPGTSVDVATVSTEATIRTLRRRVVGRGI